MKRFLPLVPVIALGLLIMSCSTARSTRGSVKGNVTERMQLIVDNLVSTYNTLDSVNFRRYFGPELLVRAPLDATGKLLRETQRENGKIQKADIDASADGLDAVVTLHLEKQTYNVMVHLNEGGRVTLFDWSIKRSRSEDGPGSVSQTAENSARYQEFADRFISSI